MSVRHLLNSQMPNQMPNQKPMRKLMPMPMPMPSCWLKRSALASLSAWA